MYDHKEVGNLGVPMKIVAKLLLIIGMVFLSSFPCHAKMDKHPEDGEFRKIAQEFFDETYNFNANYRNVKISDITIYKMHSPPPKEFSPIETEYPNPFGVSKANYDPESENMVWMFYKVSLEHKFPPPGKKAPYVTETYEIARLGFSESVIKDVLVRKYKFSPWSGVYPKNQAEAIRWIEGQMVPKGTCKPGYRDGRGRAIVKIGAREPTCPQALNFYTAAMMADYYGEAESLSWTRQQMIDMMVAALDRYAATKRPVHTGIKDLDAHRICMIFYTSALPSSKADLLRSKIVAADRRLDPGEVFFLALEACEGSVRDALTTVHSITYRNGKDAANTNKAFVEKHLAPMRNPEGYADVEKVYWASEDSMDDPNGRKKTFNPRKNVGSDEQGVWYHFFGMAALGFVDDFNITPFFLTEAGVLWMKPDDARRLRSWWSIDINEVDKMERFGTSLPPENIFTKKGFPDCDFVRSTLAKYAVALENVVRSRGGSFPDPDKQCVNYRGAAAGEALMARVQLLDGKLGKGTVALGGPQFDAYSDGIRDIQEGRFGLPDYTTISMNSPASLVIEGEKGERVVLDQKSKRMSGNTSNAIVIPLIEPDGTFGTVITPFFKVKSVSAEPVKEGKIGLGVCRHGGGGTFVRDFDGKPGDRITLNPDAYARNTSRDGMQGVSIAPAPESVQESGKSPQAGSLATLGTGSGSGNCCSVAPEPARIIFIDNSKAESGGNRADAALVEISAAGGNRKVLSSGHFQASCPRWSEKSRAICFTVHTSTMKPEIHMVKPDGTSARIFEGAVFQCFSTDGVSIYFSYQDASRKNILMKWDSTTKQGKSVFTGLPVTGAFVTDEDVKIVFSALEGNGGSEIWCYDVGGKKFEKLTDTRGENEMFPFALGKDRIGFQINRINQKGEGENELGILDLATKKVVRPGVKGMMFSCSPDAMTIVFERDGKILVCGPNGENEKEVSAGGSPAWAGR